MDSVTTPRGAGWDAAAAWYVVRMGLKAWAWDADSPAPSELTASRVQPHRLGVDLDTSPSGTVVNKQDMDTGTTHARKKDTSSPFKPRDARAAQAPTPSSLRADSASLVAGRVLHSNFPDRTGSDDARAHPPANQIRTRRPPTSSEPFCRASAAMSCQTQLRLHCTRTRTSRLSLLSRSPARVSGLELRAWASGFESQASNLELHGYADPQTARSFARQSDRRRSGASHRRLYSRTIVWRRRACTHVRTRAWAWIHTKLGT